MFMRSLSARRPAAPATFTGLESLESRVLCDATIGKESPGGQTKAVFTDSDGTKVTFTLKGPGQATIIGGDGSPVYSIVMNGTDRTSSFTIKTDGGGDGTCDLANDGSGVAVLVNGSLKSFTAKTSDLYNDFTVTGVLLTLALDDVNFSSSEENIVFNIQGNGAVETDKLKVTMEFLDDMSFFSAIPVGAFTAEVWDDTADSEVDRLEAPSIDSIAMKGNSSDPGRLEAQVLISNPDSLLKTVKLGGTLFHGTIRTAGDIGAVTVGRITDGTIFAGVDAGVSRDVLPTLGQLGNKSIKSFTIKNKTGTVINFRDSRVAAKNIGSVKIQEVSDVTETDPELVTADAPFGIVADVLGKYSSSTLKLAAAPLAGGGDFDAQGFYVARVV